MIIADSDGTERYRFEGYLPPEDFVAQLALGLGKAHFARGEWREAEERFRGVLERHADSEIAPEALYWAGVSRYKATGDASALRKRRKLFSRSTAIPVWLRERQFWRLE